MEDSRIIELYWQRNESAVDETRQKYGMFCHRIAMNILSIHEDAEECVNDTYYQAWTNIPPQRPDCFRAWLGRIVRNIAINLWRKNHAQKRYHGMDQLLSELEECIPSPQTVENAIEEKELAELINVWLLSLSKKERVLFVRRYWNGEPLKVLAKEWNVTPGKLAGQMYRLRLSLKSALEKEGVIL